MDKTIISVGVVLLALGIGFLSAIFMQPNLHPAFLTGGYLWIIVGAGTLFFGYRAKKEHKLEAKPYRVGAV